MECTNRCRVILTCCLILLSILQETSQDKKLVTYLLGKPAENCTTACASRGMSCIEVGAFPSNVLSIFRSINVTCTKIEDTSWYHYKDHPNYCISGDWEGRCMGFKIRNANSHRTLCGRGENPTIRRLCPCKEKISTTDAPSTTTLPTTTATTTTLPSSSSEITLTTTKLLGTQTRNQYTGDKTELSTWMIVFIAVAVVMVISGLFFVIFFVKKKRKRKSNSSPRIRSAPEQMSKNIMEGSDNIVYMESMVDMNSPTKSSPTDNILYESSPTDNILYESVEDENKNMMTTENPIYGESVGDERQDEHRGNDDTAGLNDEYASIDEV